MQENQLSLRFTSGLATGRRHRDRDRCIRSWLLRLIREESDVCHHEGPAYLSGPASADRTPGLPDSFTDVFTSRLIDVGGDLHLHAVVGGDGPPLLLLAGWPETWYAWRLIMPALARDYTVVAADARGVGLSDKPAEGYDLATLAGDMVTLMGMLGYERFAMFGHDVGMWIDYALAADHPERVERLALAEAVISGLAPSPPVFAPQDVVARMWHFIFNRLDELNEHLVAGREDLFLRWQFANKAVHPLPETAIAHYIDSIARSPEALHACFGFYRAIDEDMAQNAERANNADPADPDHRRCASTGATLEETITPVASDVRSIVFDDCGHFPAEEAPDATLTAVTEFFAPYRAATVAERDLTRANPCQERKEASMRLAQHAGRVLLVTMDQDIDPDTAESVAVTDVAVASESRFGPDPMTVFEEWAAVHPVGRYQLPSHRLTVSPGPARGSGTPPAPDPRRRRQLRRARRRGRPQPVVLL